MSWLEHFFEQTYSSESVPYGNGRKKQGKVYPPFKQLRDLENTADRRKVSPAQLFVAEAKLMENYEDNKPYAKEVRQFYPTYGDLTDAELRGYFTWRTQARKYIWKTMPFTFVCLYAYELINQIGCKDPLDGYEKLANLCLNYINVCHSNGYYYYVGQWLTDYVIYYDLPPFLLRDEEDFRDGAIFTLSNLDQFDDMEVGMALIIASDFRIERNRFYKQYPDDMLTVLGNVVRRLSAYYKAGRTKTWLEDYFGCFFNNPFYPFYTATFYEKSKPQDRIYEVNPARVYRVKDGHWSLRCFNFYRLKKHKPGDLIRTVDSLMREVYGCKYPVRPVVRTKWILKFIEEEVTRQWNVTHAREEARRKAEEERLHREEEKRLREARTLHLDFSVLGDIRTNSDYTMNRLMTEEERPGEEERPMPSRQETAAWSDAPAKAAAGDLTAEERRYLRCILNGESANWVQEKGLLLSVLTDSINEKLFDRFADTVLDESGIIEDYRDELKEMI